MVPTRDKRKSVLFVVCSFWANQIVVFVLPAVWVAFENDDVLDYRVPPPGLVSDLRRLVKADNSLLMEGRSSAQLDVFATKAKAKEGRAARLPSDFKLGTVPTSPDAPLFVVRCATGIVRFNFLYFVGSLWSGFSAALCFVLWTRFFSIS